MLNEERRQKILTIISENKKIRVNEIAGEFGTSEVTIRKDLEVLEKRGFLTRVHGGAILNTTSVPDLALTEKERINPQAKKRIGKKAAEMIQEGNVIILDSGSTTLQIARQIKFRKNITVITNAVNIASELAASDVEVILTGGTVREMSFSLVGPFAEATLRNVTADKLFLGVDGIHFKYGLTTPNILEAKVNQLMIEAAAEVILVADSSKFGRRSLGFISPIESVQTIITDDLINPDDEKRLRDMGISLILV
ncbi:MAG: DeoR/GlpR family DNA-binding transcription regulator [Calditrichia bacterium]